MFGLTFEKLLIIGVIAVFLLGPDRLPHYAAQLGRLVRSLRDMANGAKDRMREEMGPEFDDVDWQKLDPRQYDPRRIIREALADDPFVDAPVKPVVGRAAVGPIARLTADERAPFDSEAT
ncbi:sec-independent translocase [Agromyces atrinae]|uniref:sec-independent translocase n=1 Tax=Agromyces atrinae TaxID=592376 RepID=UPI001F585848|nr:sec-independent translocase [Agromyces atrinae]MCI2959208.1 sec-independent translocase [Agromyces atrinae]